jgi:hypothetical protein
MAPNFEKHTERVALLVTPSQKKFLQDNVGDRGINTFLRWLLDNHIEKMRKEKGGDNER